MQPSEQLTTAGHIGGGGRCADPTLPISSGNGSSSSGRTTGGAKNKGCMSNSIQALCSFALVAALLFPSSASFGEARDTSTVSAGYQHSCVVTGDATVKVRYSMLLGKRKLSPHLAVLFARGQAVMNSLRYEYIHTCIRMTRIFVFSLLSLSGACILLNYYLLGYTHFVQVNIFTAVHVWVCLLVSSVASSTTTQNNPCGNWTLWSVSHRRQGPESGVQCAAVSYPLYGLGNDTHTTETGKAWRWW